MVLGICLSGGSAPSLSENSQYWKQTASAEVLSMQCIKSLMAFGFSTSSASTNWMYSPEAIWMPLFRAAETPAFSCEISIIRESVAEKSSQICLVRSDDPSLMTSISRFWYFCDWILLIHSGRYFSALYAGIMTVTRGSWFAIIF